MTASWQKAFGELEGYISKNKTIEIDKVAVCIPGDVRPEFYRLFNEVRNEFIKGRFQNYLEDARELGRNYMEIKSRSCLRLGLKEIELSPRLNWLISDPLDGLNRALFDPLFDVLKHQIDTVKFEAIADAAIKDLYKYLFREGYNRWVTLALIEALLPDEAFTVEVEDIRTDPGLNDAVFVPGANLAIPPRIEKAQKLSFDLTPFVALLVPEVIIHSARSNCFVSMRTDYHTVYRRASAFPGNNRWAKSGDTLKNYGKEDLWPELGIYLNAVPEDLALVADYYQFSRPDIIVEYEENADWYEKGGVESAIRHYQVMQPRLGSFIVCRNPVPEDISKQLIATKTPEIEASGVLPADEITATSAPFAGTEHCAPPLPRLLDDMHLLIVGYASNMLEPIVEKIVSGCSAASKP